MARKTRKEGQRKVNKDFTEKALKGALKKASKIKGATFVSPNFISSNDLFHFDMIQDIKNFHEKFKLPQRKIGAKPLKEIVDFRIKFMLEELQEFNESIVDNDLAGSLDALVDLVYVALGTAYLLNLPFADAWREVQKANMAKVRAKSKKQSKRGTTYDVVKPKGWTAPDIKSLLNEKDVKLFKASHLPDQLNLASEVTRLQLKQFVKLSETATKPTTKKGK